MPSNQMLWVVVAAVVAVGLIVMALRGLFRSAAKLPYFSRECLLSKGELVFFQVLRLATSENRLIAPKVRLSDLINCSGDAWKAGFGARISQKHVDFVLFDGTSTAIVLVIELDDKTHLQAKRRERDIFVDRALAAAGIPILHVTAATNYDSKLLRLAIAGCLAKSQMTSRHV